MNALNRDLKKMTYSIEEIKREKVLEDPWALNFHLMPKVGWLNDPNGLCQFKGIYHVFFQYSPFDEKGGIKFWGHYTSTDLIHWKDEKVALYADQPFDCHGVYSGSSLIDEDKMYLYYTGNVKQVGDYDYINEGREHNTILAISEDGKTFNHKELIMTNKDYGKDMTCHVRDPKVWKEEDTYYMVQGARDKEDVGQIIVFASKDKRNWKRVQTLKSEKPFGYMWECPDFFELDGQKILLLSPQGVEAEGIKYNNIYQSGYYKVKGDILGDNYELREFEEIDRGFDFYAPQTFVDEQGRRILIGWMGLPDIDELYSNPTTSYGWQHALTIPRELKMRHGKLIQQPVKELEELRGNKQEVIIENKASTEETKLDIPNTFELELIIDTLKSDVDLIIKEGVYLHYSVANKIFTLSFDACGYGRGERSVQLEGLQDIRVFVDTSSLEIFINGGEEVFTSRFYPKEHKKNLIIKGQGLKGRLNIWEMKGITIEN